MMMIYHIIVFCLFQTRSQVSDTDLVRSYVQSLDQNFLSNFLLRCLLIEIKHFLILIDLILAPCQVSNKLMNSRIDKLCLPRHRRDPLLKFWQPSSIISSLLNVLEFSQHLDAKLEKIHPINPWKSLHHDSVTQKQTIVNQKYSKLIETPPKNGCNYTSMVYRSNEGQNYRFYVDFEHSYLMHGSFKRLLTEDERLIEGKNRNQPSSVRLSSSHRPRVKNDQAQPIVLSHYLPSSSLHDKRVSLGKNAYMNPSLTISRRPRDLLHVDFYPVHCSTELKKESNIETFFHRTYLVNLY